MPDKKIYFVVDHLKPKEKVQKVMIWLNIRSESKHVLGACLPFCMFALRTVNHPSVWP